MNNRNDKKNQGASTKPNIKQIEELLRTFRPELTQRSRENLLRRYISNPSYLSRMFHSIWRERLAIGIVILALTMILTPLGNSIAQSISGFFRISEVTERTEIVSLTPRPSPNPEYPYNEFNLSKIQAEAQAGFTVRTIQSLSNGWQFHNYRYEPQENGVDQLYTYSSQEKPGIYIYLTIQSSPFQTDWGFCPNSTLFETEVKGLSAEILDGAVWVTLTEPTPGAEQEWKCEAVDNLVLILRWVEGALYHEISVTQFENLSDVTITHEDLILLAEGLQ